MHSVEYKKGQKSGRKGSKSHKGKRDIPPSNIIAFPTQIDDDAICGQINLEGEWLSSLCSAKMSAEVIAEIRVQLAEISRLIDLVAPVAA